MDKKFLFFIITLSAVPVAYSLECFVCNNQDSNGGKCVQTIVTCKQEQDMCLTETKWGTAPYWQAGAKKQYYISKRCATKQQCDRTMKKFMGYCTYVWYEDWKCSECCAGDKCNYYIISSASSTHFNIWLFGVLLVVAFKRLLQ